MPNRKSQKSKKMPKKCHLTDSNQGSDQSKETCSELRPHEFEAREVSSIPNWKASVDCTETASEDGMQGSRCFHSPQVNVEEVVRSPLQNHDRMSSGRWYCLMITIYQATKRGHQALPTASWNSASIVKLMQDDLEAVLLDHTTAILSVGWHSTGEGLMEEKAQACIKHFSPYVEWQGVAIKLDFQALMLAEGWEEIRAHEAQSQRIIRGHGRPRATKLLTTMIGKVPMEIDSSPQDVKKGAKNDKWLRNHWSNPVTPPLDWNNFALSWQLLRRCLRLLRPRYQPVQVLFWGQRFWFCFDDVCCDLQC